MELAETETEGSQNAPRIAERRSSRLQDLGAVEGQNASVAQSPRSDEDERRAFAMRILRQPPKRRRSEIGGGLERLWRLRMLYVLYEALLRKHAQRRKRMREGESLLDDQEEEQENQAQSRRRRTCSDAQEEGQPSARLGRPLGRAPVLREACLSRQAITSPRGTF